MAPFLHGVLAVPTVNPDWPWDKPLYPSMEDAFEELANRPARNWQNMLCYQPPVSHSSRRGRFERFAAAFSKRPDKYGIAMGQIRGLARRLLENTEKTELGKEGLDDTLGFGWGCGCQESQSSAWFEALSDRNTARYQFEWFAEGFYVKKRRWNSLTRYLSSIMVFLSPI